MKQDIPAAFSTSIPPINPFSLAEVARSYKYSAAEFHEFEKDIWTKMRAYGGEFGQSMIEHLNRTTGHFEQMLKRNRFEDIAAFNLASAFKLHDAGKILQPAHLWGLEEKPSDAVRQERKNHVFLGAKVLEETLDKFSGLKNHPHISVIECLMRYHHDRVNGSGPNRLSTKELGTVLEIAGIVDTVDGKTIPRGGGQQISLGKALREMTGSPLYTDKPKHKGEFRTQLLADAIAYYQETTIERILPPMGKAPTSPCNGDAFRINFLSWKNSSR